MSSDESELLTQLALAAQDRPGGKVMQLGRLRPVVFVAVLAGCSVTAPAASPDVPRAEPAAVGSAPTATATPTPLASSTVEQLASAYLDAAKIHNAANKTAFAAYDKSSKALRALRRLAKAYTANELAFIRAIQAIGWWGDPKPIARRLLSCDNRAYVFYASAAKEKTYAAMANDMNRGDEHYVKCAGIANELRIAIGLPPIPIS